MGIKTIKTGQRYAIPSEQILISSHKVIKPMTETDTAESRGVGVVSILEGATPFWDPERAAV